MGLQRVTAEPAYVLHRYDWSESSLVLDVLTRHKGRITLVAKGAKKPSSNFRPTLLPLQKLSIAFSGNQEVHTLKSAEWVGGHPMPSGRALMAGLYLNELVIRLIARDDECTPLFDVYAHCVALLATQGDEVVEVALRAFELFLLKSAGVLPALDLETASSVAVLAQQRYGLSVSSGLTRVAAEGGGLDGTTCLALAAVLQQGATVDFSALMQVCTAALPQLKPQLRQLLLQQAGVDHFRTSSMARQMALV